MKRRNLHHLLTAPSPNRRTVLKSGLTLSGALVTGCTVDGQIDDDDDATSNDDDATPLEPCDPDFDGSTLLESLPFENDGTAWGDLEQLNSEGHDARLYTNLRELDADALRTSNDDFYIRTEFPNLLDSTDNWELRIRGLATSTELALDDLMDLVEDMGDLLLECSGNGNFGNMGLLSSAQWSGVPLDAVFDLLDIDASATRVLVSGFDDRTQQSTHSSPGASWIFTFDELMEAGAFLATHMNGELLPGDHGEPVRLFVPGWYGCSNIKWVDEIRFVDEDEPATSQMQEFASRTHQNGIPSLARDFVPAIIETAAMPIRIEKHELADGSIAYRVVGIVWGGDVAQPPVQVRYELGNDVGDWRDVELCPSRTDAHTWGLWWHTWRPDDTGHFYVNCRIDDSAISTNRLQTGGYLRYERDLIVDEI